jgi:hypothetical protein
MDDQFKEMGGPCGRYWGQEKRIHRFDGESVGKRPIGRTRHRWEDNIKIEISVNCLSMNMFGYYSSINT